MKVLAQKNEMMATFMAKWTNDYPGQSGHIHVSLKDKASGKSAFYDENAELNMSDIQRHFLAGQQKLMPEFLCMIAPTINSYSRMIPGFWAPTTVTWDVENRTTSLRVIRALKNLSALNTVWALPTPTLISHLPPRSRLAYTALNTKWNPPTVLLAMRMSKITPQNFSFRAHFGKLHSVSNLQMQQKACLAMPSLNISPHHENGKNVSFVSMSRIGNSTAILKLSNAL